MPRGIAEAVRRNGRLLGRLRRTIELSQARLKARLVTDELETLDCLWREYVQADPATLTEDAKELAERVRQKVQGLAGVEALEAERDALRAQLAEVEAQAAAMRAGIERARAVLDELDDAIEKHFGHHITGGNPEAVICELGRLLSGDAGRAMQARMVELDAQAAAMREALESAKTMLDECRREIGAPGGNVIVGVDPGLVCEQIETVLAGNAGRALAERVKQLEAVAQAARALVERCLIVECTRPTPTEESECARACLRKRLAETLRALEGGEQE